MQFYLDIPVQLPGGIQKTYDLIVPDGKPESIPLLVWIHGGGWCGGEKRVYNEFERFTYRGYAVLSIDYCFSQQAPFPAQLIDCKSAIRWARAKAETYGYNAEKIVVGGGSAGGHLAALLGVTNGRREYDLGENLTYSSDVQAVVDEFGPAELLEDRLPALRPELQALLHGDAELILRASPAQQAADCKTPFLIVHGDADACVPVEHGRMFARALRQAGCPVEYLEIPGGSHGFDTQEYYCALTAFIQTQLPAGQDVRPASVRA